MSGVVALANAPAADALATTVARLAAEFSATAAEHDAAGRFPRANLVRLREAGLLTLTIQHRFGGAGTGLASAAQVIGGIARGEPSTALVLAMQYLHHAAVGRGRRWDDRVYALVAQSALREGGLLNALRVEPELGTPARGGLPATVARRTAQGWSLSGHKIFCTGIPVLRWLAVWARTDEAQPRVGSFLVPADADGIEIRRTWDPLGMRATESHDVTLRDVVIPPDHAVDVRPPEEWGAPEPSQVAWNAVLVSAVYLGIAEAARDWLAGWLRRRAPSNLGAPLATLPRIQAEFGEIDGLVRLAGRLLRGAAEAVDRDADVVAPGEAGLIKQRVTGDAIAAVQRAVAMAGGIGLARRHPLERHLRDVLAGRVHTPQDDAVFLAAGRAALARDEGAFA